MREKHVLSVVMLLLVMSLGVLPFALAQDETPPAEIVNDEGGAVSLNGTVTVSNPNVIAFAYQPILVLIDDSYAAQHDYQYEPPPNSQVIGNLEYPVIEDEPLDYSLLLPIEPGAGFNDVDNDDETDVGIQLFVVSLTDNAYGGSYADFLDINQFGYSSYASVRYSLNPETIDAPLGGKYLVYAPDDQQGFPSGFGDDDLLFTEDDPIVLLPAGYTVVDLDTDPFTFDRSRHPVIDLYETEALVEDDFSEMTYTEAFDALIDKGRREYAFTESKSIDWDALNAEFRPRFEEADANQDAEAYFFAIYDLAFAIPDGHVSAASAVTEAEEQRLIGGGIGLSLRELTDGRLLAIFVLEGSPAAEAGIQYGAEVTALNGLPIDEAIAAVRSVNGPYSLREIQRLDQVRFVTRFPVDTEVEVTYKNPGDTEETTVTLTAVDERASLSFTRRFVYGEATASFPAPIEFEFLESGYGYVRVNSFSDNQALMVKSWEYFLGLANALGAPGIIVDLRSNGGGFTPFGDRLASYFFDEQIDLYFDDSYNTDIDAYFSDERYPAQLIPPAENLRYSGPVAVLVGPGCASACEYFAYDFTVQDRAAIVGQYSTNGLGGGYYYTYMPEDVIFTLPTSRSITPEGDIIIEDIGIQPTVRVPVTEENMSSDADVVLDAAIAYLDEATAVEVTDAGEIRVGDVVTGELVERGRVSYTLTFESDATINILLTDDTGDLDTYLRLYDTDGNLLIDNDDAEAGSGVDAPNSALVGLEVPGGFTVVVEVATYEDSGAGAYTLAVTEVGAAEASASEATAEATP
jgi:carboxyl-terminal processing protease